MAGRKQSENSRKMSAAEGGSAYSRQSDAGFGKTERRKKRAAPASGRSPILIGLVVMAILVLVGVKFSRGGGSAPAPAEIRSTSTESTSTENVRLPPVDDVTASGTVLKHVITPKEAVGAMRASHVNVKMDRAQYKAAVDEQNERVKIGVEVDEFFQKEQASRDRAGNPDHILDREPSAAYHKAIASMTHNHNTTQYEQKSPDEQATEQARQDAVWSQERSKRAAAAEQMASLFEAIHKTEL
jgi:hypothetical protein